MNRFYEEEDSNDRAGVLLFNKDETKLLIGHAPNKPMEKSNTWDIAKGHIQVGEIPEVAAVRELKEEYGLTVSTSELEPVTKAKYQKGIINLYKVHIPIDVKCNCTSMFDWFGKKLPEISTYKWIDVSEVSNYIYKGLYTKVLASVLG